MSNNIDFYFETPLNENSLNFWNNFFDSFPCHHNRYFQSAIDIFSKTSIKKNNNIDIEEFFFDSFELKTKEELIHLFNQKNCFNDVSKDSFKRIISSLSEIIPTAKPKDLFLLTIFGGKIQDWNLRLSKDGITLNDKLSKSSIEKTYAAELAFISNLMTGQLNDIVPTLNIEPVKFIPNTVLINKDNDNYFIKLELSSNFLFSNKNKSIIISRIKDLDLDFKFDLTKNTNLTTESLAFLEQEQERFLKLTQINYMEDSLSKNKELSNKIHKQKI